jgi:hypothetical protein
LNVIPSALRLARGDINGPDLQSIILGYGVLKYKTKLRAGTKGCENVNKFLLEQSATNKL